MVCPQRPSQEGKQVRSRGDSREPRERTGCCFGPAQPGLAIFPAVPSSQGDSLLGPWPLVADVRQEQAWMASVRCPHNRTA